MQSSPKSSSFGEQLFHYESPSSISCRGVGTLRRCDRSPAGLFRFGPVWKRRGAVDAEPFVSVGKLIRAGQSRTGSPRYALLDEEGGVSAYVLTPAGMDIGPLVNQQVGVTARAMKRGSDSLPYILAQHISSLGGRGYARIG